MKTPTKHQLAEIVRKNSEAYARETGYFSPDLGGMCGMSSMALATLFKRYGYEAIIHWGTYTYAGGHCWVESDGEIWDVTATQFDEEWPSIVNIPIDCEDAGCWEGEKIVKGYQTLRSWPAFQKPTAKKVKELTKH